MEDQIDTDQMNEEPDRFFAARLQEVVGDEKPSVFAKRAGIKDSTFRSYLQGAIPSLDKAVQISRTANVSLEWLATGYGSRIPKGIPTLQVLDQYRAELKALQDIIPKAAASVKEYGPHLDPASFGEAVALAVEIAIKEGDINVDMIKKLIKFKGVV